MALACISENFRAEMARHNIPRSELANMIGMNRQQLSMFLAGSRPMKNWAAHNIGLGLNLMIGRYIFGVNPDVSFVPAVRGGGRFIPRLRGKRDPLNPLILGPPKKKNPRRRWRQKKTI